MLTARNLADWLKTKGITAPLLTEGYVPEGIPGETVLITATGGPGERGERTRDVQSFQVVSRSGQRAIDGETLAWQVDDLILAVQAPLTIGGNYISMTSRSGGPPAFLQRDTAGRTLYACNYLFEVGRTVF